jgi:hypothetical protein
MRTRAQHLEFCKQRALEYVERGELLNAVTSMMSDLKKHPDTEDTGTALSMLGLMAAQQAQAGDREAVVRYIKGFN